jgi:hypothetical protein
MAFKRHPLALSRLRHRPMVQTSKAGLPLFEPLRKPRQPADIFDSTLAEKPGFVKFLPFCTIGISARGGSTGKTSAPPAPNSLELPPLIVKMPFVR